MCATLAVLNKIKYPFFTVLAAILFFFFYSLNTESLIKYSGPEGDALTYVFETAAFGSGQKNNAPLHSLYAQRIFMPAFVSAVCYFAVDNYKERALQIKRPADLVKEQNRSFVLEVNSVWNAVNLCFFAVSCLSLFFLLKHYGVLEQHAFVLTVIYCTWFCACRLYFIWQMHADMAAMALAFVAVLCIIKRKYLLYAVFASLAALCKEQNLQLVFLAFPFVFFNTGGSWKKRFFAALALSAVPFAVFAFFKAFPLFNSVNAVPNGITGNLPQLTPLQEKIMAFAGMKNPAASRGTLNLYLDILLYHFVLKVNASSIAGIFLMPFAVFAGLFPVLVLKAKDAVLFFKEHKYWAFFALSFLPLMMVDRYVIYLAPLLLIIGGKTLKNIGGKTACALLLAAFAASCFQNMVFVPAKLVFEHTPEGLAVEQVFHRLLLLDGGYSWVFMRTLGYALACFLVYFLFLKLGKTDIFLKHKN